MSVTPQQRWEEANRLRVRVNECMDAERQSRAGMDDAVRRVVDILGDFQRDSSHQAEYIGHLERRLSEITAPADEAVSLRVARSLTSWFVDRPSLGDLRRRMGHVRQDEDGQFLPTVYTTTINGPDQHVNLPPEPDLQSAIEAVAAYSHPVVG